MPTPGAYRELFKKGLDGLVASGKLAEAELADALAYRAMLDDPNYKFGRLGQGQGRFAPGELFLRS